MLQMVVFAMMVRVALAMHRRPRPTGEDVLIRNDGSD